MSMNEKNDIWKSQALYDLETARAMLKSGRYLYVLFCCQQSVEKMIKSVIAGRARNLPPRLHNLMRLAGVAEIDLSEKQSEILRELSSFYIQTRYPEEIEELSQQVTEELASGVLEKTEDIVKWLESISQ
jgi:HEPN domain-containing protein